MSAFIRVAIGVGCLAAGAFAQSLVRSPSAHVTPLPAGDVDGDGRDDLLVQGASLIVYSSATGLPLQHLTRPGGGVGLSYAPVGDVNGDGYDDLALNRSYPQPVPWFAEIVSGVDGAMLWRWDETWARSAGDIDADGYDDVVCNREVDWTGFAEVRSGRRGELLYSIAFYAMSQSVSLENAGDLNGDGYEDLWRVWYDGNWLTTTSLALLGPDFRAGSWRQEGAGVGDTNGNGRSDYVTRVDEATHTYELRDGDGTALRTWNLIYGGAWRVGDIDGDGLADVGLFSQPNWVASLRIESGGSGATLPGVNFVLGAYPLGDIDGDGRTETSDNGIVEWVDPMLPRVSAMVGRGGASQTSIGTRLKLATRGSSAIGRTAFFDLRGGIPRGWSSIAFGSAIDLDIGPYGAPGNHGRVLPFDSVLLPTDARGLARHSVAVPPAPALLGTRLAVQGAAHDAMANPAGLALSNGVDITIFN